MKYGKVKHLRMRPYELEGDKSRRLILTSNISAEKGWENGLPMKQVKRIRRQDREARAKASQRTRRVTKQKLKNGIKTETL